MLMDLLSSGSSRRKQEKRTTTFSCQSVALTLFKVVIQERICFNCIWYIHTHVHVCSIRGMWKFVLIPLLNTENALTVPTYNFTGLRRNNNPINPFKRENLSKVVSPPCSKTQTSASKVHALTPLQVLTVNAVALLGSWNTTFSNGSKLPFQILQIHKVRCFSFQNGHF